jgi:hypothetical protein
MIPSENKNSHHIILDYQLPFLRLRNDRVLTAMRLVPKCLQLQPVSPRVERFQRRCKMTLTTIFLLCSLDIVTPNITLHQTSLAHLCSKSQLLETVAGGRFHPD